MAQMVKHLPAMREVLTQDLVTLDAAPYQPVPLSPNVPTESMLAKCFKYAMLFVILPTSIFSRVK